MKGQATLMVVLMLGVILAAVVLFGAMRQADMAVLIERLDTSQTAQEVLSAAAKRVQNIYANQAGCDPESLDTRLSCLPAISSDPTTFGAGMSFAVAQPANPADLSLDGRTNRCSGTNNATVCPAGFANTGCRQFAVPLENRVYVVTVGAVVTGPPLTAGRDCPRDASIRLSVAVGGNVYFQRFTLINICTLDSCNTTFDDFTGITASAATFTLTAACSGTNANVPARRYGSIVSTVNNVINLNDLRWARRYVETGAGGVGETTFMYTTSPISDMNGACAPGTSANQCRFGRCIPAFDLNRDRTNNEADLAIMEVFMRGYLPFLPVNQLDPRN
jgi:type II secretory pathway pseudopilin PulG